MKDLIVFDMDGVLVDVAESYRATIQATVHHFTGYEPSRTEIQDWKNRGGYNDDWKLSYEFITGLGGDVRFDEVVTRFQEIFHGDGSNGLILKERWIAQPGTLESLAATHTLGIFTGRLNWEAKLTLDRFTKVNFDPIMGVDNVEMPKPHPEGLIKIRESVPHGRCWYIGDTVDDAKAGKAAGVPFIGIVEPHNSRYDEVVRLLREHGAVAILPDINTLEQSLV